MSCLFCKELIEQYDYHLELKEIFQDGHYETFVFDSANCLINYHTNALKDVLRADHDEIWAKIEKVLFP